MEWLEDVERVSEWNLTIELTVSLIYTLLEIQGAGVHTPNMRRENMLVNRRTRCGKWVGFSHTTICPSGPYDQKEETSKVLGLLLNMYRPFSITDARLLCRD
jgi:hypothetical protein